MTPGVVPSEGGWEHGDCWELPILPILASTPWHLQAILGEEEEATVMSQCPQLLASPLFPAHTRLCSQELSRESDDRSDYCRFQVEWPDNIEKCPPSNSTEPFSFPSPIFFYNKQRAPLWEIPLRLWWPEKQSFQVIPGVSPHPA